MNKYFQCTTMLIALAAVLFSCSNKKETPESIAAQWCELNSKVFKSEGEEKAKAQEARTAFEKNMEAKYNADTAMMKAIFKAVEACENASEGRASNSTPEANADPGPEAMLPLAYAPATATADAYCSLIDKSIESTKNSSDAELKKAVAAKLIFEKNMEESYKDDPERRDSIFKLIEPCVAKEMKFRSQ